MLPSSWTSNIYGRWYLPPMSFDSLLVNSQLGFCFALFPFSWFALFICFCFSYCFCFFLRLETSFSFKISCCICRNLGNAVLFPRNHVVNKGLLIAVTEDLIPFSPSCHLCGAHMYTKAHTKIEINNFKNQLTVHVWPYMWVIYSIYQCDFIPVPHYFYYHASTI